MPRTIVEIDRSLRLLAQLLEVTKPVKERENIKKKIDIRLEERYEAEYGSEVDTLSELIEAYTS